MYTTKQALETWLTVLADVVSYKGFNDHNWTVMDDGLEMSIRVSHWYRSIGL